MAELRRMEARARRFVADVSHELRTPLAAMSAVTDVLDEDAARLDPDTAMAVRLISGETVKLARLVDDLMEISRFDAGAAGLQLDDLDLAESLRRTLAARGWQDTVDTLLPGPGELRGRVDPRRLDVAVANLVGNALRHGARPVQLRLYAREMPDAADDTAWAVIEVTDSGPGIPADVLPHVFDRFYKSDTARTRSEGSGLGLSIAAENVRLHGGTVRAANRAEGDGGARAGRRAAARCSRSRSPWARRSQRRRRGRGRGTRDMRRLIGRAARAAGGAVRAFAHGRRVAALLLRDSLDRCGGGGRGGHRHTARLCPLLRQAGHPARHPQPGPRHLRHRHGGGTAVPGAGRPARPQGPDHGTSAADVPTDRPDGRGAGVGRTAPGHRAPEQDGPRPTDVHDRRCPCRRVRGLRKRELGRKLRAARRRRRR